MKANQIESCQKYLLIKTYEWYKKASCADLIKKGLTMYVKNMRVRPRNTKSFYHGLIRVNTTAVFLTVDLVVCNHLIVLLRLEIKKNRLVPNKLSVRYHNLIRSVSCDNMLEANKAWQHRCVTFR